MSSPVTAQTGAFVPFTKAERIQQLNDIDKSITQLLKSAGLALQILAVSQESDQPIADRKKAFEAATNTYLSTLNSVDIGLQRQILGLEEANVIIEKKKKISQEPQVGGSGKQEKDFEGGTGKLDIGWLNTRSRKVGRDNEAELWEKARKFLEAVNEDWGAVGKPGRDQDMGT